MAQFIFKGDPNAKPGVPEPSEITAFGVAFKRGVPSEVTDATAIRKLSGHTHFAKVDGPTERLADAIETSAPSALGPLEQPPAVAASPELPQPASSNPDKHKIFTTAPKPQYAKRGGK